jgi:hypothetical protein
MNRPNSAYVAIAVLVAASVSRLLWMAPRTTDDEQAIVHVLNRLATVRGRAMSTGCVRSVSANTSTSNSPERIPDDSLATR